ncbi:MAG: gliding motility protein GldN [Dysgonamonadaceae bacterium]|jgi:gliding motility associated protien GldN|nr:gliding motility protein GldN [Dysgonamonadaceae bacterium]
MKPAYYIVLLGLFFVFSQTAWGQERERRVRQRPSEQTASNVLPSLTERAKIKNEIESKAPEHVLWEREIYRFVDLTKENNAALYFPIQPVGNRMNLFTILFKLLMDGKIPAYNFLDGREVFTEEEKIDFENLLTKYQVLYSKEGERISVADIDIPSPEVTMYMIKERYFFDAATGTFQTEVMALCPLLVRYDDDFGGTTNDPLFWVKYDDIRPYISREMIMTSNYNNALTYTIDDYFRKQMYSGEIVKTTNLMGQSLAQQVGNEPEALKHAQDSIEGQLKDFNKKLWVISTEKDTTTIAAADTQNKRERSVKRNTTNEKASSDENRSNSEKSTPTRSVRRNRR